MQELSWACLVNPSCYLSLRSSVELICDNSIEFHAFFEVIFIIGKKFSLFYW